jgi:hypothetical protein
MPRPFIPALAVALIAGWTPAVSAQSSDTPVLGVQKLSAPMGGFAGSPPSLHPGAVHVMSLEERWFDMGFGLTGTGQAGLVGAGSLVGGEPISLTVSGGPAGAAGSEPGRSRRMPGDWRHRRGPVHNADLHFQRETEFAGVETCPGGGLRRRALRSDPATGRWAAVPMHRSTATLGLRPGGCRRSRPA